MVDPTEGRTIDSADLSVPAALFRAGHRAWIGERIAVTRDGP